MVESANDIGKELDKIKDKYVKDFSLAAMGYLHSGLSSFHKSINEYNPPPQVPLGILAIAIELMLKAIYAEKCFPELFDEGELNIKLKAVLENPSEIPDNFSLESFAIPLRSYTYYTKGFEDCMEFFLTVYPHDNEWFSKHLEKIKTYRNLSVHSFLPTCRKYELKRAAYLAIIICLYVNKIEGKELFKLNLTDDDGEFFDNFIEYKMEELIDKMDKVIKASRLISLPRRNSIMLESADIWDYFQIECPFCGGNGILYGHTELSGDIDKDGNEHAELLFVPNSYKCLDCRLRLVNYDELLETDLDIIVNRSNELEKYFKKFGKDSLIKYVNEMKEFRKWFDESQQIG